MLAPYSAVCNIVKVEEDLRNLSGQLHGKLGSLSMFSCCDKPVYISAKPMQCFVPKDMYDQWKERCLWFVDYRVLWTVDALEAYFKKNVTVNNWHIKGGNLQYRCWRPPNCSVGAALSQHKFGRAADCDIMDIPAADVRKEILSHPTEPAFRFISCIEDDVTWLHFDTRNHNHDSILVVKP